MEAIPGEILSFFTQYGVGGALGFIFLGLYLYERKQRSEDRDKAAQNLEAAHKEHKEDLKIVLPMVQKFTSTMDTVLPILMNRTDRGQQ